LICPSGVKSGFPSSRNVRSLSVTPLSSKNKQTNKQNKTDEPQKQLWGVSKEVVLQERDGWTLGVFQSISVGLEGLHRPHHLQEGLLRFCVLRVDFLQGVLEPHDRRGVQPSEHGHDRRVVLQCLQGLCKRTRKREKKMNDLVCEVLSRKEGDCIPPAGSLRSSELWRAPLACPR